MSDYYNEFDPHAASWLENLKEAGEIPQGRIDDRSIVAVRGTDLAGVRQAHFFAGIGGWPLALKLAGWPEDKEVWTGSCPCQPFSSAGKGKGVEDERHLWPEMFRLIKECRPATVFGEQVGSKAGIGWLDGVQADLEGEGYACGAVIVGAHSVGAPHIRQRIYWVACSDSKRSVGIDALLWKESGGGAAQGFSEITRSRHADGMANTESRGVGGGFGAVYDGGGEEKICRDGFGFRDGPKTDGPAFSPWSDFRIIPCTDGKARRAGARVFPLAYGLPRGVGDGGSWRKGLARGASRARRGMLKGSGNAIVPTLAAEFIRAFLDLEAA